MMTHSQGTGYMDYHTTQVGQNVIAIHLVKNDEKKKP